MGLPYALRNDSAMGCSECCSADAAKRNSSSADVPGWGANRFTEKTPSVNVPVLSKATVRMSLSASRKLAPLISMPFRAAAPRPAKKPRGTEMTKAHGQGGDQEQQSSVAPNPPTRMKKQRWNERQHGSHNDHGGCVHTGEAGDKALCRGFALFGLFHQPEDAGYGAVVIVGCDSQPSADPSG